MNQRGFNIGGTATLVFGVSLQEQVCFYIYKRNRKGKSIVRLAGRDTVFSMHLNSIAILLFTRVLLKIVFKCDCTVACLTFNFRAMSPLVRP